MNYEEIGNFIAKKRKEKNLTQKELALKIGVTDKAVSKWERGLGCPDISLLEVISNELDISILELLNGKEYRLHNISKDDIESYVKDTINYSKKSYDFKIKKIVSTLLIYLICFISILVIILNISHYLFLNHNNNLKEYNFEVIESLSIKLDEMNNKIDIIKNSKYSFNTTYFVSKLEDIMEKFRKSSILDLNNNTNIKINDLVLYDRYLSSINDISIVYYYLSKCDENVKDKYNNYVKKTMYYFFNNNKEYKESYRYVIYNFGKTIEDESIINRVFNYRTIMLEFDELLDTIIEMSDDNE